MSMRRFALACVVLFSAGCSLPMYSRAEYENGIMFEGNDGVIFKVMWWNRDDPTRHCSLVVHLADGTDLDVSKFASPNAMRNLGAKTQNEFQDEFDLMLEKPGMWIGCSYIKARLEWVMVNLGVGSRGKASFTVNGKDLSLPITEEKLFEALGQPRSFEKKRQQF